MTFVFTCKNILKHQRAPSYAQKYQQLSNQKISRALKLNMPRIPHNLYKKNNIQNKLSWNHLFHNDNSIYQYDNSIHIITLSEHHKCLHKWLQAPFKIIFLLSFHINISVHAIRRDVLKCLSVGRSKRQRQFQQWGGK